MISYICVVLYNSFYIVLACVISLNLMMVHFYPMSWMRKVGPGSPKVTELVQGAQRGNCWGRLSAALGTVFCVESENTAPFTWLPRWGHHPSSEWQNLSLGF